jgi:hypothetical protein
MMEAEQMMIDDALHHIEDSETDQYRADQHFARPGHMRLKCPARQDHHTNCCKQIRGDMKKTIPHDIEFQISKIVRRVACAGQHMMPLQDLMQDNPIKEAAKSQPKKYSGYCGESTSILPV